MPKKPSQLPLKKVLAAIDKRDKSFYNSLSDEQKKEFNPWMMMRFCSSVQGKNAASYIYMANELVNKNFSDVKDPEMQWLLLCTCGSGKVETHPFIKPAHAKKKKNKIVEFIQELKPHMKLADIELLVKINSSEELKDYVRSNGYDDKSVDQLFR